MLSDHDIRTALQQQELDIQPWADEMVRACGITLHLGATLLKPLPGSIVDPKNSISPTYERITITADSPYQIEPGEFLLGHTYQRVTVGDRLGFLIEGRSTLARVGLTIVQTAMLVYPGHTDRCVTLELANHGPNPIRLYEKMKIARVALLRLDSPTTQLYDHKGKYRKQEDVGPPIFENEFLDESAVRDSYSSKS